METMWNQRHRATHGSQELDADAADPATSLISVVEFAKWGGNHPAIISVDGILFTYGGPAKDLATGAYPPTWPHGVILNDIAYWREK